MRRQREHGTSEEDRDIYGDDYAVETDRLVKRFGNTTAVNGINIRVQRGEVYGFLGPNGAGKTTTMRMLTGLTRPTGGSARVAGVSIDNRSKLVWKVGYAPDTPPLYEELTGWEQIRLAADIYGVDDDETATERYLARFDMLGDAHSRISGYSKGMRQKINVIQSVIHSPEVLFLDEPTGGLDPRAANEMEELLCELSEAGTTVFLSTHILEVVERAADRVGLLHDGELLTQEPPDELVADVGESNDGSLNEVFLKLTRERQSEDQR